MDDIPRPNELTRVARTGPRLPAVVGVLVAFIALAIAKPWDAGGRSGAGAEGPAVAARTAMATATRITLPSPATASPDAASVAAFETRGRRQCQQWDGWRAVSVERLRGSVRRSLFVVDPVAATSATDPHIPTARLYAEELRGIGYCAPRAATEVPVPAPRVRIWQVVDGGVPRRWDDLASLDEQLSLAGEYYFARPRDLAGAEGAWPPGRYVFEIRPAAAAGGGDPVRSLWFAIDFQNIAGPVAGATQVPRPP